MRRGRILILLGLILAIGAAAIVFVLLSGMSRQPEAPAVVNENVVVAIQPIAEDEPVEGRLEVQPRPKQSIPEGTLRSLEGLDGMLAAGPIPQGAMVHTEMLISPEERLKEGELGRFLEEGFVAVAHPIDELASVSYGIQPGDRVDILMTFYFVEIDQETQLPAPLCPPLCPTGEGTEETLELDRTLQQQRPVAQLTVQDAQVLGVGRWGYEPPPPTEEEQRQAQQNQEAQPVKQPPKYLTLMLTPQDALVLKLAREFGASIDFAVRAQDDHQIFTTQQVTLDYILARFGITVPTKQPYTIQKMPDVRPTPEAEQ